MALSQLEVCKLLSFNSQRMGTASQIVGYQANGEASDWMFGTHRIIACSPELGIDDPEQYNFYINNRTKVFDLIY